MEIPKMNPSQLKGHLDLVEKRNKMCEEVLEKQRLKKLEKLNPKPIKKK